MAFIGGCCSRLCSQIPFSINRPTKRRKLDEPHHTAALLTLQSGSRQQDQQLMENFIVAIDCWDFLQSNITYRGGTHLHNTVLNVC